VSNTVALAPSGFENPGVSGHGKKPNHNKIQEISGAPLIEQAIVGVALFPFAAAGWMAEKAL
jgi:hypothetical protein